MDRPLVIAGPCSAESESQVLETARGLKPLGVGVFRAGLWKPRTHPGGFEGVGEKGLSWLARVREETGMKTATEVAGAKHVEVCLESGAVDILWIGARTTSSPFLVQEIAEALRGTDIPVFVKNPLSPDMDLWSGALERLSGVGSLGLIHRGFTPSGSSPWRNDPLWRIAIEMRTRFPGMPFLVDPSHIGGDRRFVGELSQKALDLGFDGLMIEAHCNPSEALSDAAQQLSPSQLGEILSSLRLRRQDSDDAAYREVIDSLRARIDDIDESLLALLADRQAVSREIGRYKKEHGIAIVQAARWDEVMTSVLERAEALGLPADTVRRIFTAIHAASVRSQE